MSISARQKLAAELRDLRNGCGFKQADVAAEMEWSLSKLSRIEKGITAISMSDLRTLLACYGVPNEEFRALLATARRAKERRGWWTPYRQQVPSHLIDLAAFEAEADKIMVFEPIAVPDLLQTWNYVTIVHDHPQFQRQRRAEVLSRAPELTFILDESVLYRHPDAAGKVLPEQLRSLIEDAERPNVTVHVLPYTAGAHVGWSGGFNVMSPGNTVNGVAQAQFDQLLTRSLDPEASGKAIRTALDTI